MVHYVPFKVTVCPTFGTYRPIWLAGFRLKISRSIDTNRLRFPPLLPPLATTGLSGKSMSSRVRHLQKQKPALAWSITLCQVFASQDRRTTRRRIKWLAAMSRDGSGTDHHGVINLTVVSGKARHCGSMYERSRRVVVLGIA